MNALLIKRRRTNMKPKTLTLGRAVSLAIPLALFAAVAINAQMDKAKARTEADNAAALRQYEWKSRTEIRKDGETTRVEVASFRYDEKGQLQKTMIGSTPSRICRNLVCGTESRKTSSRTFAKRSRLWLLCRNLMQTCRRIESNGS